MPRQWFHIEGLQLNLGKAEGNRRTSIGRYTLIGKLLEEGHIAVAVDRVNHRRITTGAKTFDFANDGLIILMVEGGIPPECRLPSRPSSADRAAGFYWWWYGYT